MHGLIADLCKGYLFSPPPTLTVSPDEMQKPCSLLFNRYHCSFPRDEVAGM